MIELDEIQKEIRRLSHDVLLLTGLVRELQALIEKEMRVVKQLKVNAADYMDLSPMDFPRKYGILGG